jgi:aminoglycoside phosphotransferase (APT) family kinase protein
MALRRPPRIVPEGRNETMLREYRLLAALGDTDVPHARALAVCDDPGLMGGCFYLMDYVDGWSPLGGGGWPAPFDTDLGARAGLGLALVDGIAKLAKVDWQGRGLEGFGRPDGFHERQVDRWMSPLAQVQFRPLPVLDVAAQWLRTHRPRHYVPGIMHGDYQFANVMFAHGAPARLAAIVDWEMATVGDPLLDLGWVVQGWIDPDERHTTGSYVDYTALPTRAEILDYYANESGRHVDDIDYYVVLARFKLAVVLEGGYARVTQGRADNPKMEAFGPIVLDLAQKAADLASTSTLR